MVKSKSARDSEAVRSKVVYLGEQMIKDAVKGVSDPRDLPPHRNLERGCREQIERTHALTSLGGEKQVWSSCRHCLMRKAAAPESFLGKFSLWLAQCSAALGVGSR
jgi:hypothetical protein